MEGNVVVATTVNNINLQELTHVLALKDSASITIMQDITLHSPSLLGGLKVLDGSNVLVAGIDLQDIVLRDTDAVITGEDIHKLLIDIPAGCQIHKLVGICPRYTKGRIMLVRLLSFPLYH